VEKRSGHHAVAGLREATSKFKIRREQNELFTMMEME
jgi:hypothetical protein